MGGRRRGGQASIQPITGVTEPDPLADPAGSATTMWTCPRCGQRFVSPNMWHSWSPHTLVEAFARSEPNVRACFERFVELVERCGPVVVIPEKTRIVFMGQVRFGGAQVRRNRLLATVALSRRVDQPRFRHESFGPRWIAHRFELRDPTDLDDPELQALICESYRDLGQRESLNRAAG